MDETESLGVLAHRGGPLVVRPELTVGVVRAVARPRGLEIELLARQPLDRRSATERQDDIRAGRGGRPAAPRQLLPQVDEGINLRVAWLDEDGHPHWTFGGSSSRSGDETLGPSLHTARRLPPLFDRASLVLAWPEIGFPETVVTLQLPDRATVERQTLSVWQAPVAAVPTARALPHRVADTGTPDLPIETGRVVAAPRVLHRDGHAVVVLTRVTAVASQLSLQLLSLAKGDQAQALAAGRLPPHRLPRGCSIAVVRGGEAFWAQPQEGMSTGDSRSFMNASEFTFSRPEDDVLDLLLSWPLARIPDARARIPLDPEQ